MNSAIMQSVENNLRLRVMTAKAKIIAHAEETAREFFEELGTFSGTSLAEYEAHFTAEAEEKENGKTEKENILQYCPAWMTATRWKIGERKRVAKSYAYGLNRVLGVDAHDRTAREEHRQPNTDKPALYIKNGDFHKDPRPMWTKNEERTA